MLMVEADGSVVRGFCVDCIYHKVWVCESPMAHTLW